MLFNITEPTNSLEWVVFLAEKYSNMFIQGTILTLYIAISGTILGFILGYVVGLIQDIRIRKEDNIAKAAVLKLIKAVCRIYVGDLQGHAHDRTGDDRLLRSPPVGRGAFFRRCRSPGNGAQHRGFTWRRQSVPGSIPSIQGRGKALWRWECPPLKTMPFYRASAGVPQYTS